MGKQFDRVCRLLVGVEGSDGIVIEGKPKENALNITFDIDKDLTKQTKECRVQVFNLSDKTAKIFERMIAFVFLKLDIVKISVLDVFLLAQF